jgi:hypothetical protein
MENRRDGVCSVSSLGLGDIDLALRGPRLRICAQQPEGGPGPDAFGQLDAGLETSTLRGEQKPPEGFLVDSLADVY